MTMSSIPKEKFAPKKQVNIINRTSIEICQKCSINNNKNGIIHIIRKDFWSTMVHSFRLCIRRAAAGAHVSAWHWILCFRSIYIWELWYAANITIKYKTSTTPEMQRTDRGTKITGELSTKNRIFPSNAQNGFLLFPSF